MERKDVAPSKVTVPAKEVAEEKDPVQVFVSDGVYKYVNPDTGEDVV